MDGGGGARSVANVDVGEERFTTITVPLSSLQPLVCGALRCCDGGWCMRGDFEVGWIDSQSGLHFITSPSSSLEDTLIPLIEALEINTNNQI